MPTHFRYLKGLGDNQPGYVGTSGTFAVQLPAVAATSFLYDTMVTLTGVLATDVLMVNMMKGGAAAYDKALTCRILGFARPMDGSVFLQFVNIGSATGYSECICAYTVTRIPT